MTYWPQQAAAAAAATATAATAATTAATTATTATTTAATTATCLCTDPENVSARKFLSPDSEGSENRLLGMSGRAEYPSGVKALGSGTGVNKGSGTGGE